MRYRTFIVAGAAIMAVGGIAGSAWAQGKVRGVTKDEIIIGMHTDLSGPAQFYGVSSANGQRMRIEELNAQGGVHGRKIRLIVEDTQYQVPRAVQAANKLINRDNIFVMVGALGTPMNNAVMKDQFAAGVPNIGPITAARQMHEPFHPMKFAGLSTYYEQIRAGVKWMVESKGKKSICSLYQDTDFGQEIFEGTRDQLQAMNMKLVETATHKPTDSDFTAQITKLRNANCDLITMGTIIRDTIIPVGTAKKMGWNDVDFIGTAASYDYPIAAAPGGATEGFYSMSSIVLPYDDTASAPVQAWIKKYKDKYGRDINAGSLYGYNNMELVIVALDRAGRDLTTEKFVKAFESIQGFRDIFGGPIVSFGPNKHKGTSASFLHVVKNGRWEQVSQDALVF